LLPHFFKKGNTMSSSALFLAASVAALALGATVPAHAAGPTDPQIAHIAYTADVIDITNAKLALQKSRDKDVRTFAEDMIRDHEAVNNQALALVKKLNVTPEDNATSQSLVRQADAERSKLAALNGHAFNKAYVANEVAYHKTVDSALETTLIPSAQNAELKTLLQTGLKIFQGHEQHAERLYGMME
jgi:putative membrane protein